MLFSSHPTVRQEEGAALIFALGTLTLLLSLGSAFLVNMTNVNRQTEEYVGAFQARLAAQSGLERAIAELRGEAQQRFAATSGQAWYWRGPTQPSYQREKSSDSGRIGTRTRYTLKIVDEASKINLNDDNPHQEDILEGLPEIGSALAERIVLARKGKNNTGKILPSGRYTAKEQLLKIKGIGPATYGKIKDFVTTTAYQDPNTMDLKKDETPPTYVDSPRCPINVNTAPWEVLAAVFRPILGDNQAQAQRVAQDLVQWQARGTSMPVEMKTWRDYEAWWSGLRSRVGGISDLEYRNLKDNPNPNRKNAWRNATENKRREKYSTEFCFHSGGYYDIQSTGELLNSQGTPIAKITVSATAQIYKIFNITKKEQFRGEDLNGDLAFDPAKEDTNNNGVFDRAQFLNVTWADDCPVNSTQETAMGYVGNYDRVNDSLKLGFWDDFEDEEFSRAVWKNTNAKGSPGSNFEIENSDTRNHSWERDNDKELHHTSDYSKSKDPVYLKSRFGVIDTKDYWGSQVKAWGKDGMIPAWNFGNAYIRADVIEDDATLKSSEDSGHDDVAWLGFRSAYGASSQVYARYPGINYWAAGQDIFRASTIYKNPLDGGDEAWWADENKNPLNKDRQKRESYGKGFPILMEEDWSVLPRDLVAGKLVDTDNKTYKETYIKYPTRIVFFLGTTPTPRQYVDPNLPNFPKTGDGQGSAAPIEYTREKYVLGGKSSNKYEYFPRRTYRLYTVNRIVSSGYLPGVRLQLCQEGAPGNWYPDKTDGSFNYVISGVDPKNNKWIYAKVPYLFGEEINTFINPAGTIKLQNHGSFPSWDNIRVITPMGKYQSAIIDAGPGNILWGTIAWTVTLPQSANPATEKVCFEPRSYAERTTAENLDLEDTMQTGDAGDVIQKQGNFFDGNMVGSGQAFTATKGRIKESGSPLVGRYFGNEYDWGGRKWRMFMPTAVWNGQRYLIFRAWLTSERYASNADKCDPSLDDSRFLKETPVLEDMTVTYIPPTRISGYREKAQ